MVREQKIFENNWSVSLYMLLVFDGKSPAESLPVSRNCQASLFCKVLLLVSCIVAVMSSTLLVLFMFGECACANVNLICDCDVKKSLAHYWKTLVPQVQLSQINSRDWYMLPCLQKRHFTISFSA